jgi:hypothetical protein
MKELNTEFRAAITGDWDTLKQHFEADLKSLATELGDFFEKYTKPVESTTTTKDAKPKYYPHGPSRHQLEGLPGPGQMGPMPQEPHWWQNLPPMIRDKPLGFDPLPGGHPIKGSASDIRGIGGQTPGAEIRAEAAVFRATMRGTAEGSRIGVLNAFREWMDERRRAASGGIQNASYDTNRPKF